MAWSNLIWRLIALDKLVITEFRNLKERTNFVENFSSSIRQEARLKFYGRIMHFGNTGTSEKIPSYLSIIFLLTTLTATLVDEIFKPVYSNKGCRIWEREELIIMHW